MIIKINMKSETPIYLQLRNEIVKGIGKGEFEIGESLPTVRQMAAELGVNTMTVSKAYQLLKSEGFIVTDRRKGTIVCTPQSDENKLGGEFQEKLADELELLSAEASIRGMEQEDFMELCRKAFQRMEVVYL
jgi:GntR family transcriptional regulator